MFRAASVFNQPLSFDTSSVITMSHMFYSAAAFNQPLSFDTSSVTDMTRMFDVRSSPCPAPNLQPSPPPHAACAVVARRLPPPSPQTAPHYALFTTRQITPSLSNANKLLIRCAWAGTSAFATAGYGSNWGSGSCPPILCIDPSLCA